MTEAQPDLWSEHNRLRDPIAAVIGDE